MIIAPFLNVIALIVLLDAIVLAVSGNNNPNVEKTLKVLISYFFPFFLLYGFCTSSGIYMIVSLLDKERKMRQYMYLAGVGPWSYYLGLYCADFLLYLITVSTFTIFIFILQLAVYTSQFIAFASIMVCFGAVLIPFTYLFQHWFKNSDSAFRFIGVTYICLGCLLPIAFALTFTIITLGSPTGYYIGNAICYSIDPLYVFYDGIYNLVFMFISKKYFPNQPVTQIMVTQNIPASPEVTCITMLIQAFLLVLLVVWKDSSDCNQFKKVGGRDGNMQP